MAISDWPLHERPREKLLAAGAQSLSDAELLAIFLRTGVKGKTAVDVARDLIKSYKGLRRLLEASFADFQQTKGLGLAKYVELQAVLEISRRHLRETLQLGDAICNPTTTRLYLMAKLRHYQQEVFGCLFLDNQHRVLEFEELFRGTINSANIYPRELIKRALYHNAAAVILAHNHPSGSLEPSKDDVMMTQHLQKVLALIEVRVLDHLIIGNGEATSMVELGLI
jgi:DNA repair protein RadC